RGARKVRTVDVAVRHARYERKRIRIAQRHAEPECYEVLERLRSRQRVFCRQDEFPLHVVAGPRNAGIERHHRFVVSDVGAVILSTNLARLRPHVGADAARGLDRELLHRTQAVAVEAAYRRYARHLCVSRAGGNEGDECKTRRSNTEWPPPTPKETWAY